MKGHGKGRSDGRETPIEVEVHVVGTERWVDAFVSNGIWAGKGKEWKVGHGCATRK